MVCGACLSGESWAGIRPSTTSPASRAMSSIAVTNRSSSASGSDSVGSTISVPGTGKDIVGAWKPWSIRRLAMSSTVTP